MQFFFFFFSFAFNHKDYFFQMIGRHLEVTGPNF